MPRHLLGLFAWDELELMVCGTPKVDVDLLRQNTTYGASYNDSMLVVQWFWETLKEWTDKVHTIVCYRFAHALCMAVCSR